MIIDEFLARARKNGEVFRCGEVIKAGTTLIFEINDESCRDLKSVHVTPSSITYNHRNGEGNAKHPVIKIDYQLKTVLFHNHGYYWLGMKEGENFAVYVMDKTPSADKIVERM
jgi:hypothetical protein